MPQANMLHHPVNPEQAKINGAGPLLYAWAKRAVKDLPPNEHELAALVALAPDSPFYEDLGGAETKAWVKAILAKAPVFIDVLGLPYGGPNNGKDNDGNWFSPETNFMDGENDAPSVMYGHGGMLNFDRHTHGRSVARWYDQDGGWFKVLLDPESPRFEQLYEAHVLGLLRASTGVIPATADIEPNGHIKQWQVGELSLIDLRDGIKPSNGYAITKALLFEGTYGDPVMEAKPGFWETVKKQLQEVRERIANWQQEDGPMAKCDACDAEAAQEAEDLRQLLVTMKAEQDAAAKPKECLPCRAAVKWVGTQIKAHKLAPLEALDLINRFEVDATGWETIKDEVEARDTTVRAAIVKGQSNGDRVEIITNAPGNGKGAQQTVDNEYLNRMRSQVNLPVVK